MTILYKPVLIETAEQAEALPDGVVLIREDHFAFQKHAGQFVSADPHDLPTGAAWEVVGWTALVPIEAEEVIGAELRHQVTDKRYDIHVMRSMDMDNARWQIENNPKTATGRIMRRYHTPWEEA